MIELSLNPCSNGICSLTKDNLYKVSFRLSLNPCSNGICSLTEMNFTYAMVNKLS